jgi:uncharacterized protein (TIGR03067 family)
MEEAVVVVVLLTVVLGMACWPPVSWATDTRTDDRAISVGRWRVVAVDMNGREIDPEMIALLEVAYREDGSWAVLFKGLTLAEGTSTNDQDASPKTCDMETAAGEHSRPQKYVGIYRIEADVRWLCFVEAGKPRPDEFVAPRGSGRMLVKLQRRGCGERHEPRGTLQGVARP